MIHRSPLWSDRRRLLVLLGALLAMALTARLGWWQLDRADTKTALAEQLAERRGLPALDNAAVLRSAAQAEAVVHRGAALRGRWVPAATVFLDNRPMGGKTGFYVVTPLLLEGSDQAILVQRGWVPRDFQDRTRLPAVRSAEGVVEVRGVLAPPPSQLYALGAESGGAIRQNIALPAFARETGLSLLPMSVLQSGGEDSSLRQDWSRPGADVAKHHGYAFQWFALCALIGLLYVWFQLISPRRKARA